MFITHIFPDKEVDCGAFGFVRFQGAEFDELFVEAETMIRRDGHIHRSMLGCDGPDILHRDKKVDGFALLNAPVAVADRNAAAVVDNLQGIGKAGSGKPLSVSTAFN